MVKRCIRQDLLKKESQVTFSSFYANSVALSFTYLFFPSILSPSIGQSAERATHLINTFENRVNTWKIKCEMSRVDYGSPDSSLTCKVNSLQQDRIKEYRVERKQCEDFITFVPNFCI